ncbi:MAG: hypothetical protein ACW975_03635 [Candidatus Thorarchaeota archaeon]|jgi:hypothetical protein
MSQSLYKILSDMKRDDLEIRIYTANPDHQPTGYIKDIVGDCVLIGTKETWSWVVPLNSICSIQVLGGLADRK